jgi:hypothetical protein
VSYGGQQPVLPVLLVYPYLGETTTSSVVISWATDRAGTSEVHYSLDQSYLLTAPASSTVYDGKHWHSATIVGLIPDTTYYYRIYTDASDLTPWSQISFNTAPMLTASDFTFTVLGDSQLWSASGPPSQGALDVAAQMEQRNFDLALHAGDSVHSGGVCTGSNSGWNQYIRAYFDVHQENLAHAPFYPCVGNHNLMDGICGYQAYQDVHYLPANAPAGDEEKYYSFNWGNAHFVVLNSNQPYGAGTEQYNWLLDDLQTSTQPWKFVLLHHPAYSSGNVHGSTLALQTHLVPIFEAHGVDVVFSGHDHIYERTCPILNGACVTVQDGGIPYYVTGGGGGPLYTANGDWFTSYADSLYHFLKVDVGDCLLRVDAIDSQGNVFDTFQIDHCSAPTASGWDRVPQILAQIAPPTFPARDFLVTDYGAVGDGTTDSRAAFDAAISA